MAFLGSRISYFPRIKDLLGLAGIKDLLGFLGIKDLLGFAFLESRIS